MTNFPRQSRPRRFSCAESFREPQLQDHWCSIMALLWKWTSSLRLSLAEIWLLFVFATLASFCAADVPPSANSSSSDYTVLSAVAYPKIQLRKYEFRYYGVELPDGYSVLSVAVSTDGGSKKGNSLSGLHDASPLLCIRSGAIPLPQPLVEVDIKSNIFVKYNDNATNMGQCTWLPANVQINVSHEQVSSSVIFLGIFNGIGPERTQSKMIRRGSSSTLSIEITVFGCKNSFLNGPFCNVSTTPLVCSNSSVEQNQRKLISKGVNVFEYEKFRNVHALTKYGIHSISGNVSRVFWSSKSKHAYKYTGNGSEIALSKVLHTAETNFNLSETQDYMLTCEHFNGNLCIKNGEWNYYSLKVLDISSVLELSAQYMSTNSNEGKTQDLEVLVYVRYNAFPQKELYDYLVAAGQDALIIPSPRIGLWYIGVYAFKLANRSANGSFQEREMLACVQLLWKMYICPNGMGGDNCKWNIYKLERIKISGAQLPFESFYAPMAQGELVKSGSFPLEQFLSNSSGWSGMKEKWTFFIVEAPLGAAGGVMSLQITSFSGTSFQLYAKFGSLPTLYEWDYSSIPSLNTSNSTFNHDTNGETQFQSIDIIYPKEGTWCLGLRQTSSLLNESDRHLGTMSVFLQGCPRHCSKHGSCQHAYEESGLILYNYCSCDRTHGGFDCSIELLSPTGHKVQSLALILSNIAAIFPAVWSIRQKAYAEWIIYTVSGLSSAIYHACDTGVWCALSFHVLQFMDFWLSFMAVVATSIYMSTMKDKTKISVHVAAAIATALIAINGPTRPINVLLVAIIGITGLILGWITRFCGMDQITTLQSYLNSTFYLRFGELKRGMYAVLRRLRRRFRWIRLCVGFVLLGAAGTSWFMETGSSYWIWHSLWHFFIYTSSFFFLWSTVLEESSVTLVTYQPVSQSSHVSSSVQVNQTELVSMSQ